MQSTAASPAGRRLGRGALASVCWLGLLTAFTTVRAQEAAGGVQFADVTVEAGIDFTYVNGASGQKFMPEAVGSGAAFVDADGDGFLDLYVVNGAALPGYDGPTAPNAMFHNSGDGIFEDVTTQSGAGDEGFGMAAAVGDYDSDGDADLYVANYGANVLFRNEDGRGNFADVTVAAGVGDPGWGTSAVFVDYDRDGDIDLYVANYMSFSVDDNKECFGGKVRSYCGPTTYPGQSGVLYRNDGDAGFADVTEVAGLYNDTGRQLSAVFGDIDDDGDQDLFVANDKTANFLFVNNDDGTFTETGIIAGVAYSEEGLAESAMGADLGDYDNDGSLDIIVATFQWLPNTLYRNEADGFFTDITFDAHLGAASVPFLAMTSAFFDYDNDGHLDIMVTNGHLDDNVKDYDPSTTYEQLNQVFRNNGDGTFTETTTASGPGMQVERVSHGAVFGDYDNDGDIDVFISDSASPQCTLLRNDGGNDGNFLMIRARGTLSNREGIGARVRAVAGDLVQTREIRRGYGYMGSNDVRLHLGLGPRTRVDSLQIRWPSGIVQTLVDVPAGQFLNIEETAAP